MYEELKAQKIQEMEGLVQEQDSYIVRMGEVGVTGMHVRSMTPMADSTLRLICFTGKEPGSVAPAANFFVAADEPFYAV